MRFEMSEARHEMIIDIMSRARAEIFKKASGNSYKLGLVKDLSMAINILQDRVEESGIDTNAYRKS